MSHLLAGVVGSAVGDALGVPYDDKERDSFVCEEMIPIGKRSLPIGFWSDDTSMILAELDSLGEKGKFDAEDVMTRFMRWIHEGHYTPSGSAYGIGRTTSMAISRFRSGTPADLCGGRDILDNGSGALMRILPYALLKDPNRLNIIEDAGSITHAHQISRQVCRIYSYYVDELLKGRSPTDALEQVLMHDTYDVPEYYIQRFQTLPHMARVSVPNSGFAPDLLQGAIWVTNSF